MNLFNRDKALFFSFWILFIGAMLWGIAVLWVIWDFIYEH